MAVVVKYTMSKRSNLIGKTFGRLTVVANGEGAIWHCKCSCGGEKATTAKALSSGHTASCGCLGAERLRERNTTHGLSRDHGNEYRSWKDMRSRCNTPTDTDYKDYGGRGIKVCARWDDFAAFFSDMGERPASHTIDRINVHGDYEPSNCRWATAKTQNNNKRSNHLIEWRGARKTLSQWCSLIGIDPSKVRYRLKQGWPLDLVFSLGDFRK